MTKKRQTLEEQYLEEKYPEGDNRRFVCGTREVVFSPVMRAWKVVCATCGKEGTVPYTRSQALAVCTRLSSKACKACGAS